LCAAAAAAAAGVYPGVTTSELDELAAQTAAYMATQHPGWSQLAARISVSNLHKNTCKVFSENIEQLHKYVHPKTGAPASLISDEVYEIVQKHKDTLNSAIINDRDCECGSFLYCLYSLSFVTWCYPLILPIRHACLMPELFDDAATCHSIC
jgi:hypothetical protein